MDGAVQLLAAIKKSKNEWVPMAVDVVIRCINVFVEYMNSVIDTELYSRSIIEWTKTSDRQSVADFVGETVYHTYSNGIAKPRISNT